MKDRTLSLWRGVQLTVAVLGLGAVAASAAAAVQRYALASPRFALRHIEVVGAERLDAQVVTEHAGLRMGENLLALDPRAVETRLLDDPWIDNVRVLRVLPGTVRIELGERDVGALLNVDERLFVLDTAGHAFKLWEAGDPFDLPVVTGVTALALMRDRPRAEQLITRSALAAITGCKKSMSTKKVERCCGWGNGALRFTWASVIGRASCYGPAARSASYSRSTSRRARCFSTM
jgi:cell division septal protein FtsQ